MFWKNIITLKQIIIKNSLRAFEATIKLSLQTDIDTSRINALLSLI